MSGLEKRAEALWRLAWRARHDCNWARMLLARSALRRENSARPKLRRLAAVASEPSAAA